MSGPPYPPPPAPGSNAIGSFEIGVSPIGTIPPFNPWTTVIRQYANSNIIDGLILSLNTALDLTKVFDDFFDNQFNPDTATGYGLDVVGRIVNASRTISIPGGVSYFGWNQAGALGWGQGPFYSGQTLSTNYNLGDPDYRRLIFAKMMTNICDGSIPAINKILLALFPNRGACYVTDGGDMTMTYTFNFTLSPVDLAIIEQEGVLPTPTGVVATVVQL
jgi:hypothetical protein